MKTVTENLALLTLLALVIGVVRLYAFYDVFGIDVTTYVDISEVLQLQFFFMLAIGGLALYLGASVVMSSQIRIFKRLQEKNEIGLTTKPLKEGLAQQSKRFVIYTAMGIATLISIILVAGMTSRQNARKVLNGVDKTYVTLVTDSTAIKTDTTLLYLGKTKAYVFLYDKKHRESRVMKVEDLKEIKYRNIDTKRSIGVFDYIMLK